MILILTLFQFFLQINAQCDGNALNIIAFESGQFSHTKYHPNERCIWTVNFPQSGKVLLSAPLFSTELGFDTLNIFNNESQTDLKLLSGTPSFSMLVSTATTLIFTFTSDSTVQSDGFTIAYQINTSETFIECSKEVLTSSKGFFGRSPLYSSNEFCSWLITPSLGHYITITFLSFDTETNFDFVRIYDGNSSDYPLLGSFSGKFSNFNPITTSQPFAYITFTSDRSESRSGFIGYFEVVSQLTDTTGFLEEITTRKAINPCSPVVFNTTSGNFGREGYQDNEICIWYITPPVGFYSIKIEFTHFNTQSKKDVVTIYDGINTTSDILGVLSGSISTPFSLTSSQAFGVMIIFKSDETITKDGFQASFTCLIDSELRIPEDSEKKRTIFSGLPLSEIIGGVALLTFSGIAIILVVRRIVHVVKKRSSWIPLQPIEF